jgi:hypothetical protein
MARAVDIAVHEGGFGGIDAFLCRLDFNGKSLKRNNYYRGKEAWTTLGGSPAQFAGDGRAK